MVCDYEEQRQQRIQENKAILVSLGLDKPLIPTKSKTKKKVDQSKKRGAPRREEGDTDSQEVEEGPKKLAKVGDAGGDVSGLRRSARNKDKTTDYANDGNNASTAAARALPRVVSSVARAMMQSAPRKTIIRKHDPKTYGSIPGIPVGSWWETREACSKDAIHAPWVAGISAGPKGAYSVALSGGYEDDIDLGEAFTFTGSGGRDLKGTKDKPKNLRTAPQSCDQTFENPYNAALLRSSETKMPIRVIRGYKLDSPYAPAEGYRYDGLYTVEKAWQEAGLNKGRFKVCKFALKRIAGQAPLPADDDESEVVNETTEVNEPSEPAVIEGDSED